MRTTVTVNFSVNEKVYLIATDILNDRRYFVRDIQRNGLIVDAFDIDDPKDYVAEAIVEYVCSMDPGIDSAGDDSQFILDLGNLIYNAVNLITSNMPRKEQ